LEDKSISERITSGFGGIHGKINGSILEYYTEYYIARLQ